jgi:S1-C subfamily serine protease
MTTRRSRVPRLPAWLPVLALAVSLGAAGTAAAPREGDLRPHPRDLSAQPSYVQRVEPAVVGLSVEVPADRPSALTLGTERWGSGVIFDAAGHVMTVSYVVLDALRIEATLRDGRKVPARPSASTSRSASASSSSRARARGRWPSSATPAG